MMRLPWFKFHSPRTVAEAAKILAGEGPQAMLIAGGTDLVPNMKRRHQSPKTLVSLRRVEELKKISNGSGLRLGAGLSLSEVVHSDKVRSGYTGLYQAAAQVATVHLRNMGTLGGNLCLDTRCTYYNQTYFWREALGFCLKKSGTVCHVVPQGKRCVAAHSSDVAPMLIALGAQVEIAGPAGRRTISVESFFVGDGIHNNVLAQDELVTRITVPAPARGLRTAYQKLRPRGAIDFPMLSIAVAARGSAAAIESLTIVVSALGAKPRTIGQLDALAKGRTADESTFAAIAQAAHKQCRPLTNVPYDDDWRHAMVPVFVTRALREAFAGAA